VSQTETVDLAALARDAAARLRAGGGPVRDVRVTATGGACLVQGSARDLAEVIEILLDNALKFSPGDMQVRVELAEADGRVALAVTDLGTGFAPELAREVFRPFTIADVVHHSRGTGLSLALAAAIIDAHGGSIRAQSEGAGKGARFTVEVPACR
jgi:two-component system CheB/CheR fusion protein